MSFVWPYALIALPLALAGVLLLFKSSRRARQRLLGHFATPRLLPLLLASHSPVLRRFKQGILLVGILLTVLALARPQWGYDWQEKQSRGVDVIFVLDTSKSMLTQDVQPNRLERAKLAILDTVEKMGGNRIGLVAFAGDAFLLCPLTLDYDAFRQTLEAVDVNTIARGGTDIGAGLDEAAAALEKSGNHKIIVLLTDGEDLEGEGINEAKALASQNVTIYTVGVGTPQGDIIPIRDANGGTDFVRDQRGQIVKSHLDAATLTSIAEATHGFYQPLGATGEGLAKVYEEGIKKIPEQTLSAQMQRQPIERYQWPLAAGTLLLALEMLIGTRRPSWRRNNLTTVNLADPLPVSAAQRSSIKTPQGSKPPVIATALLLTLFLAAGGRSHAADSPAPDSPAAAQPALSADTALPPPSVPTTTEPAPGAQTGTATTAPAQQYSAKDAQSLFQKGDYLGAAEAYGQAADANPQDGRFRYDQGESLYRGGNYDSAADAFSKTLSSNDLQLQERSYYNLGNTHYRLGEADQKQDPQKTQTSWEQAVKDYQNALELNADDADARYNLGVVKQQLEVLKKQMEQQKQQQNQQDKNGQKQDQQQNQSQNQQQNQSQQNQSQQNQQQNQSGQQNNSQPNQSQNGQKQPQNQSGQQNSSGSPSQSQSQTGQPQPQNQPGQQNSSSGNKPNQQNSPGSQNQPHPGQGGQQKQPGPSPTPGDQNKPQNQGAQPGQKPSDQNQNGQQPQAAAQNGTNPAGQEPGPQNAGQQKAAAAGGTSGAAAASSSTDENQAANGTVVAGGMTREEARQLLDSLKSNEHKLPATNLQNSNAKPSPDQYQKDW
jgi:Ca-activated chloride channel family protein